MPVNTRKANKRGRSGKCYFIENVKLPDEPKPRGRPSGRPKKIVDNKNSKKCRNWLFDKEKIPEQKFRNAISSVLTKTKKPPNYHSSICSFMDGTQRATLPYEKSYLRIAFELRNCILNENWNDYARLLKVIAENEERFAYYRNPSYKAYLCALIYDPVIKGKDYFEEFLSCCFDCNTKNEMERTAKDLRKLKKLQDEVDRKREILKLRRRFKEPALNLDDIDLKKAETVRELFSKPQRKQVNVHNRNSRKI